MRILMELTRLSKLIDRLSIDLIFIIESFICENRVALKQKSLQWEIPRFLPSLHEVVRMERNVGLHLFAREPPMQRPRNCYHLIEPNSPGPEDMHYDDPDHSMWNISLVVISKIRYFLVIEHILKFCDRGCGMRGRHSAYCIGETVSFSVSSAYYCGEKLGTAVLLFSYIISKLNINENPFRKRNSVLNIC